MKTIQMRTVEQRQWRRSGGVFLSTVNIFRNLF